MPKFKGLCSTGVQIMGEKRRKLDKNRTEAEEKKKKVF